MFDRYFKVVLFLLSFLIGLQKAVATEEFIDIKDFGEIVSFKEAVKLLLDDKEPLTVDEQAPKGGEVDFSAVVSDKDNKWYVKAVEGNGVNSKGMDFRYEWFLKENKKEYYWLKAVKGRLVLPERNAIFTMDKKKYYISSYPFVEGKTYTQIYRDFYREENEKITGGKQAFYRYGQVAALMQLDPDDPSEQFELLLGRVPRLSLSDRNGSNELYNRKLDTVYLVDLAKEIPDEGETEDNLGGAVGTSVKSDLAYWLGSLFELISEEVATGQEGVCGQEFKCVMEPLDGFAKGYISVLQEYQSTTVKNMIMETALLVLIKDCSEVANICEAKDYIKSTIQ